MRVFIIGIKNGKFILQADKEQIGTCALDAESLADLLRKGDFKLKEPPENVLMHSSSVNHPKERGAPEGFKAHEVIEAAMVALAAV